MATAIASITLLALCGIAEGAQCGTTNSVDCRNEFNNAHTNNNVAAFCNRCNEGGANPIRNRCKLCCDQCFSPPTPTPTIAAATQSPTRVPTAAATTPAQEPWSILASNETNETEIIIVMPTTTPTKPVTQFTMTAEITMTAVAALPSDAALRAAIQEALPGADPKTVVVETEFNVKQALSIQGVTASAINEDIVKHTAAALFSVSGESIELMITFSSTGRRLADRAKRNATIVATMTMKDPANADAVKSKASNTDSVGEEFKAAYTNMYQEQMGAPVDIPTVSATDPVMEMVIKYTVASSSGEAIAPPTAVEFMTKLAATQKTLGEAPSRLCFASGAPCQLSVAPTPLPTAVPTDTSPMAPIIIIDPIPPSHTTTFLPRPRVPAVIKSAAVATQLSAVMCVGMILAVTAAP